MPCHIISLLLLHNAVLHGSVLFGDATSGASAGDSVLLLELVAVFGTGSVQLLFEDWLMLDGLELVLCGTNVTCSGAEAVTAAARLGKVVGVILKFVAFTAPGAALA